MSTINDRIALVIEKSGLSKTAFGERINVSQQYVSKLVREGKPSDRTLIDICREFNVNREWLNTGQGDMFLQQSRNEEIAAFMGEVLSDDTDFRGRLIAVLSRLTPEQWKLLEQVADRLMEEMQKEKPGD